MSATADRATGPPRQRRWAFSRSRSDRVLAGVAGGLGHRWAIPPVLLRVGFVVLSAAGPVGLLLYGVAWLLSEEPDPDHDDGPPPAPLTMLHVAGLAAMALGALLLLREIGLWAGDALVWPLAVAAAGSAVIWARGDRLADLPGGSLSTVLEGRGGVVRVAGGSVLVVSGLLAFLAANEVLLAVSGALMAVVATTLGLALIGGPWALRTARQLTAERRERIRSEERAEMAAHLHDSVLHTLALIQRSDDDAEMASLARAQERELRGWLYGGRASGTGESLAALVDELAGRVERLHRVPVEAVVVGEAVPDERVVALVDAASEATVNAARHSGADQISVYVEAEPEQITAFIRDEGKGFDPDTVPVDRRGIADSIRGRMERHGGSAQIHTAPGEGTEVQLELPMGD